jgi:hypothetical protein
METPIEEEKVFSVGNIQLSADAICRLEFIQNGLFDEPEKNSGLLDYQLQVKEIEDFIIDQLVYGQANEAKVLEQLKNIHQISLLIDSLAKP